MNREEIVKPLADLGERRGVNILYAVENGSRAWGLESTDSDYDVRFIYVRPSLDAYLTLNSHRDVIEEMQGLLDMVGWDIKKALSLGAKSNPSLVEWLHSPVNYGFDDIPFVARFREAMSFFSRRSLGFHYLNLARRQYKAYWKKGEKVRLKKYVYAVRPLLCVEWLARFTGGSPPLNFDVLRDQVGTEALPSNVNAEIDAMLELKHSTTETSGVGRFHELDKWIEEWLGELGEENMKSLAPDGPSKQALDELFRETVMRHTAARL